MRQDDRRLQRNIDSIARSLENIAQEMRYMREMIEEVISRARVDEEEEPDADRPAP